MSTTLARSSVNVTARVQEIVAELRQQQPERLVQVRVGELSAGAADPSLLKQVLVNLLSNAFKFTRQQRQQ
jgi:two-component system, sensor histidine kinase and response regulator